MALAPIPVHGAAMAEIPFRYRRRARWVAGIVAGVFAGLAGIAAAAGFLDRDPVHVFAAQGTKRPVGVLYLSGDMGLRFGPGPSTVRRLAAQGITVVGLNMPTLFRTWRTRGAIDRIVAEGVRDTLTRVGAGTGTGAERLVLIGQSYGADILQTGLVALPAPLRARVAGVVLVVPGDGVFFRADPSGLAYRGTPDSRGAATLARLDWTPLTCIHGVEETDSVCPDVRLANATVVAMPGGHFLHDDDAALSGHILAAIRRAAPGAFR